MNKFDHTDPEDSTPQSNEPEQKEESQKPLMQETDEEAFRGDYTPLSPEEEQKAEICALCDFNRMLHGGFFYCGHSNQKDQQLKNQTVYNGSCSLFKENRSRKGLYDNPARAGLMKSKYKCRCGWSGDMLIWVRDLNDINSVVRQGYHGCPVCKGKKITKNW